MKWGREEYYKYFEFNFQFSLKFFVYGLRYFAFIVALLKNKLDMFKNLCHTICIQAINITISIGRAGALSSQEFSSLQLLMVYFSF